MRGVVIAGTHSGCGKTTITLGIMAALREKGLRVQSFKAGPDFIDSGLHRVITGRPSRNLDIWMCGRDYVRNCFKRHSMDVDISIVEGVMGLYDGEFSTTRLANVLNLPVILIVDAYGMAESAGAVVKGFRNWGSEIGDSKVNMAGIIFNRVASENHYKRLKNSVQAVPVLGYLEKDTYFEIPSRHLGLTVAEENPISEGKIQKLADTVLRHINVDFIVEGSVSGIRDNYSKKTQNYPSPVTCHPSLPVIAIAYDKAFCFYYEDNLDLLRNAGADIVRFSPLYDSALPDGIDAIYIGGGYPELYAEELSRNISMLESIHNWADSGRPIYAECGGLMYLSQGIHDFNGNFLKMTGIFPFETQTPPYPPLRPHLGYREVLLKDDCIIGKRGDRVRGHEFHYSEIKESSNIGQSLQYKVKNSSGQNIHDEGYKYKNTLASYIHIHFGSNPDIAGNFIDFIREK